MNGPSFTNPEDPLNPFDLEPRFTLTVPFSTSLTRAPAETILPNISVLMDQPLPPATPKRSLSRSPPATTPPRTPPRRAPLRRSMSSDRSPTASTVSNGNTPRHRHNLRLTRRRTQDLIGAIFATPRRRKIYDTLEFTYYESEGQESLSAPPTPPFEKINGRNIELKDGDMVLHKGSSTASPQTWVWDAGTWCPVEAGHTRQIRGKDYVFEYGPEFLPRWVSAETIQRRARRQARK